MAEKTNADDPVAILNAATPDELNEMVTQGALSEFRRAQADLAAGKPGAQKAVRKVTQDLLEMFTNRVQNGVTPDQPLLEFVAGQYRQVIHGGDQRALFPYARYIPNNPKEVRGKKLATEVEMLRRPDRENLSLEKAIWEVVDRHPGLSEHNLRKIHRQYHLDAEFAVERARGIAVAKEIELLRGEDGSAMSLDSALANVGEKHPDLAIGVLRILHARYKPWGRSIAYPMSDDAS